MVARAVRIDRASGLPYENQAGYIFCPDDPLMRRIITQIRAEQQPILDSIDRERREKAGAGPSQMDLFPDIPSLPRTPGGIIPLASELIGAREQVVGASDFAPRRPVPVQAPIITEKEREDALRKQIDRHVKEYAAENKIKPVWVNVNVKAAFAKPRENMTRPELERLLAYLEQNYRLGRYRGAAAVVARAVAV